MYLFSFEKLEVWKESKSLVKNIYELTKEFPSDEKYGLTSQLRRASVSIASNLAEGTSRNTKKDKAHFTSLAYSSTMEVLNQLIIAQELELVTDEVYTELRDRIYKITNMLNALKKAQLNS